jgi:hypothetical protein
VCLAVSGIQRNSEWLVEFDALHQIESILAQVRLP